MVTKEQHNFFKSQYEEENARYESLIKKGQLYLSIQTFLLSAVFFNIKDLQKIIKDSNHTELLIALFCIAILMLLASILFNVLALKISTYERVNKPREVLQEFDKEAVSDGEFYLNRIVDFTVATERNFAANNTTAKQLKKSIYLLALGLCLTIFLIITMLIF